MIHTKRQTVKTKNWTKNFGFFFKTEPKTGSKTYFENCTRLSSTFVCLCVQLQCQAAWWWDAEKDEVFNQNHPV